jgi:transposase-like protein
MNKAAIDVAKAELTIIELRGEWRRFLSFRDVEDLLAKRGIAVSYETPNRSRLAPLLCPASVL